MTTYPFSRQDKFARVNEIYEIGLGGLNPCAKLLHRWLVRMAKPFALIEINLLDFQKSSQNYRNAKRGGFCFRWIKKAFKELVTKSLVLVEHKYNNKEFKVKVRRPDDAYFSSPIAFTNNNSVPQEKIVEQSLKEISNTNELVEQSLEEISNTNELVEYNTGLINIAETLKRVLDKKRNFSSENGKENSENGKENSKKEESNDANSSSYNRYNQRTTNTQDPPSSHPVVVSSDNSFYNTEKPCTEESDNKSEVDGTNVPSHGQMKKLKNTLDEINKPSIKVKTPEIPSDFLQECKDAKICVHPQLIKKMREFTMKVLKNALAVVQEQVNSNREVRNPTGLFVQAMTNEWKPTTIKKDSSMKFGVEFHNWYQKAVSAGLVEDLPINFLPVVMNKPMVRIPKPQGSYPPYDVMSWTEARDLFGDFEPEI